MKDAWIQAVSKMTYGIYVLTSARNKTINGMIASWVSMVSFDPPLIMAAVHTNRYSHILIEKSGHFTLNILSQAQVSFLSRFKGPDSNGKFAGIRWEQGINGCPILLDSIGYIECKIKENYNPGNHTLFIGKIIDAKSFNNDLPLSTADYEGVYLGKN
jgi:flavin reductase (DIM6/NTAB) family NADH-FMN oxidoreductase RutF